MRPAGYLYGVRLACISQLSHRPARAIRIRILLFALGASLLLSLEAIVIIECSVIGAMPLSGVAAPFLCWGRTSMVVNFFLVALILSVSSRETTDEPVREAFEVPQRRVLAILMAVCCVLLCRTRMAST